MSPIVQDNNQHGGSGNDPVTPFLAMQEHSHTTGVLPKVTNGDFMMRVNEVRSEDENGITASNVGVSGTHQRMQKDAVTH